MVSPFVYEEPVEAEDLIDRETELGLLGERAFAGRNARVEGPRRFGKTSLLRKLLRDAGADDLVGIYVNFLGVLTVDDVAERIERAYREQLDSALRRWFDGLVRTFRPTLRAGAPGLPVAAEVKAAPAESALLDRLATPRRLHDKHGRRCVIVFDEFQDVIRAGEGLDGTLRSELEQHGDAASYVFCGSHPGMMRELFASRRRAFFGQAAPVVLGPLGPVELAEHIGRRFAAHGREPGEALGPLLDLAAGHPQRVMLLAHHLFVATGPGGRADTDTWTDVLHRATREVEGEIVALWEGLTATQRRVCAAIADGRVALHGREASERYDLARGGATARTAEALRDRGDVVADEAAPSGWRIVDPLFALWLAGGRQWPV